MWKLYNKDAALKKYNPNWFLLIFFNGANYSCALYNQLNRTCPSLCLCECVHVHAKTEKRTRSLNFFMCCVKSNSISLEIDPLTFIFLTVSVCSVFSTCRLLRSGESM